MNNQNLASLRWFQSDWVHYVDEHGETHLSLDCSDDHELEKQGMEREGSGQEAFFYYFGQGGCLPDSDFFGPFKTEKECLENALELFGSE